MFFRGGKEFNILYVFNFIRLKILYKFVSDVCLLNVCTLPFVYLCIAGNDINVACFQKCYVNKQYCDSNLSTVIPLNSLGKKNKP